MLPKPWTEIESRVKQGETLQLTGEARGLHVVMLATPTIRQLVELIQSTPLLDEVRHANSPDAHAVSNTHTVVGVGPAWKSLKREVGSSYSGTVSHHLMEDAYPRVLSWSGPGDTFVFMFAFDLGGQRPPEEYHDMLPNPDSSPRLLTKAETFRITSLERRC